MRDAATLQAILHSDEGRRDPYPVYAELHQLGPVCVLDRNSRFQAMVQGYHAVNALLRDPGFRVVDAEQLDRMGSPWRDHPCQAALITSMFFRNEPEHSRLRGMFSQVFTPARVKAFGSQVAQITDHYLDQLAAAGADGQPVDFIANFALGLPGVVISELMGVPIEDREWFLPRAQAFGDALDLGVSPPHVLAAGDRAALELREYFADLVRQRRKEPQEDVVTEVGLLYAERGYDDDELMAGLLTFFNAGFVTTTHMLGNGLTLMLNHPTAAARLTEDPELAAGYVEEILRCEAPTHFVLRWAAEDREIAGTLIPKGSAVLVLVAAANRDPSRYQDPDTFDPYRVDSRPLTFGAGPHYCMGHALSRLEGQVALPMILRRFPGISIVGEPTMLMRYTLRGYGELMVTL